MRDFSCLANIELILESGEETFSSKISFSNNQTLWSVAYKNRVGQMAWSQFSIKTVGLYFCNSPHDKRNWDKILDNLTKEIRVWDRMRFSSR